MVCQIRQRLQAFCFYPPHRPNQTPPTLVSPSLHVYLPKSQTLKLNIYTTKFNYLVPKPYSTLYSFPSIHFPRDLRFLIQSPFNLCIALCHTFFSIAHTKAVSNLVSFSPYPLQSLIAKSIFPKHHWIKTIPYRHTQKPCRLLN